MLETALTICGIIVIVVLFFYAAFLILRVFAAIADWMIEGHVADAILIALVAFCIIRAIIVLW